MELGSEPARAGAKRRIIISLKFHLSCFSRVRNTLAWGYRVITDNTCLWSVTVSGEQHNESGRRGSSGTRSIATSIYRALHSIPIPISHTAIRTPYTMCFLLPGIMGFWWRPWLWWMWLTLLPLQKDPTLISSNLSQKMVCNAKGLKVGSGCQAVAGWKKCTNFICIPALLLGLVSTKQAEFPLRPTAAAAAADVDCHTAPPDSRKSLREKCL